MARRLVAMAGWALLASGPALAAGAFDGRWGVVLTCPTASDGALGYTYRFDAMVTAGALHGQNGVEDTPGYLVLDGAIRTDGTADLLAHGQTGNPAYAVGQVVRRTPYSYPVQARFTPTSGTGQRMAVRACTFTFEKYR